MTQYAICFDFPEAPGEPLFAGWYKGALAFAPQLETAAKFETEDVAQRTLDNGYGAETRKFGCVVEVPA